jgi:hypothetical protein
MRSGTRSSSSLLNIDYIYSYALGFVRKPLRFYDIAVGKIFLSTSYRLVELEIKYPHGVERRVLAVAVSPYTGHECYSFAPKRSEVKAVPLSAYFEGI